MHWIKIYFQNQNAIRQNILSQQNADIRSNHSADSDVEKGEKEHSPPPPYEEKKKYDVTRLLDNEMFYPLKNPSQKKQKS